MKKTVEQFIKELQKYPKDKFIKVYDIDSFGYFDPEIEDIGDEKITIYADK